MVDVAERGKETALNRLRVIEIANGVAGPGIGTFLADFGADVIKLEEPGRGDMLRSYPYFKNGVSLWFKTIARNKRSATLKLNHPKGQELLKKMILDTDILISSFRPGVLEKWGLGYEELKQVNPGLVMLCLSAYGQTGPYRDKPGFATVADAFSGFAAITGFPDKPPSLAPYAFSDEIAALAGAYAVMVAIYHRKVNGGEGQFIDLSIYEPVFHILGPQPIWYDQLGIVQERMGNRVPSAAPRNLYRTSDGRWVAVAASAPVMWQRICQVIGREELIEDPRFKDSASRVNNVEEVDAIMENWIGSRPLAEVMQRFEELEVASGPVYDISQIFADPHYRARRDIVEVEDPDLGTIRMQNVFAHLSETPGRISCAGPRLGEYSETLYKEVLGLTDSEYENLRKQGVI